MIVTITLCSYTLINKAMRIRNTHDMNSIFLQISICNIDLFPTKVYLNQFAEIFGYSYSCYRRYGIVIIKSSYTIIRTCTYLYV